MAAGVVEQAPHRAGIGQDVRRDRGQRGEQLAAIDLGLAEPAQQRVVVQQRVVDAPFERLWIGEIAHPDRAAPDFVLVSRADAAAGGTDLLIAPPLLAGTVERAVRRQDQRRVVGKPQIMRRDLKPLFAHRLDLGDERPGIDDDAAADDRKLARADDPRREQAELVLGVAD